MSLQMDVRIESKRKTNESNFIFDQGAKDKLKNQTTDPVNRTAVIQPIIQVDPLASLQRKATGTIFV